jgi:hypothetical protein
MGRWMICNRRLLRLAIVTSYSCSHVRPRNTVCHIQIFSCTQSWTIRLCLKLFARFRWSQNLAKTGKTWITRTEQLVRKTSLCVEYGAYSSGETMGFLYSFHSTFTLLNVHCVLFYTGEVFTKLQQELFPILNSYQVSFLLIKISNDINRSFETGQNDDLCLCWYCRICFIATEISVTVKK